MGFECIKYENHLGEIIEFGKDGIYVNANTLRDYSWSYTSSNSKVSSFYKKIQTKSIPIIIATKTEAEGIAAKNLLFETIDKDVLTMQPGRFWIGDYYLTCYIQKSVKKKYSDSGRRIKITLTAVSDNPIWQREVAKDFEPENDAEKTGKDYNFEYAYDYMMGLSLNTLTNSSIADTDFILTIYGTANSPKVYISGHEYSVNTDIGAGEYLTINSQQKTIQLTKSNGKTQNLFSKRNRDSYIFEKIPSGISKVSADGDFRFNITLLEERGEPLWI
jgi:hypothetical protein